MSRIHSAFIAASAMLFLVAVTACSESDENASDKTVNVADKAANSAQKPPETTQRPRKKPRQKPVRKTDVAASKVPIMNEAVNFSSAEDVKMTIKKITEQAGKAEADSVQNAMQYLLFYDLSVAGDPKKLNKKLNGKTPNEIIALTSR